MAASPSAVSPRNVISLSGSTPSSEEDDDDDEEDDDDDPELELEADVAMPPLRKRL